MLEELTQKQHFMLEVITKGNDDGSYCDLDQILERLETRHGWKTTKSSLQFSIRIMILNNLIRKMSTVKRRGRSRRPLAPTLYGHQQFSASLWHQDRYLAQRKEFQQYDIK